jgi:biliverdin reductase/flavin reductase
MEQYLENECKDLDYTIVRPPGLIDDHIIGRIYIFFLLSYFILFDLEKEIKVREDDYYFPDQSTANQIPRANVARFMLDILKDEKYIRQGVAIAMTAMMDKSG